MPIILYKLNASPPARAVMMTLDILGLKVDTIEISTVAGDQYRPEFLQKNPLHTIPVIEDGDFVLADSHAIITYLVSKYGADRRAELYPSDLQTRATVDQRLFFETSHLFPKIRQVVLDLLKNKAADIAEQVKVEVHECYGFLETYLEKTAFLAGDHVTLADISCVASVSSLDTLIPVPEKFSKVHEWLGKLKSETWYQNANEPGLTQFAAFLKNAMENNAS